MNSGMFLKASDARMLKTVQDKPTPTEKPAKIIRKKTDGYGHLHSSYCVRSAIVTPRNIAQHSSL
jgi:hypothetical protein